MHALRLESPALRLAFTAASSISSAFIEALLEGWLQGDGAPEAAIQLHHAEPPACEGAGAPIGYGDLRGRADDRFLHLATGTTALHVAYETRTAEIWLSPRQSPDLAFCRDTLLRLAAIELCRTLGRFYLHAAAPVFDGGTVLACGMGGIGKSTLAAACWQAGLPVLADDAVVLVPGEVLQVARMPAAWRVSGVAAGWCGLPPVPDKQRFWPPFSPDRAPVRALCLLERGESSERLPLSPAEALPVLIRQNPLIMVSRVLAVPHLVALQRLVDGVPCWRLVLGPELLETPAAIPKRLM